MLFPPFTITALAALIPAAVAAPSVADPFAGYATLYTPGAGACGTTSSPSDLVVALSSTEFTNGARCGQKVRVVSGTHVVDVTVVDKCTSCSQYNINLSEGAFQRLGPAPGPLSVFWVYN